VSLTRRWRRIAAHRGVPSVAADQVKAMTKMEAEDIYRRSYWGQSGGDLCRPASITPLSTSLIAPGRHAR